MEIKQNEKLALNFAKSSRFLNDIVINGYLLNADIMHIGYGNIYANDEFNDGDFISFICVGTDNRNGYDIVKTLHNGNFVIVTYAPHAKERGLSQLKRHIKINESYYDDLINGKVTPFNI